MADDLSISIGAYSDRGRKEINQDFHGTLIPQHPVLGIKGIATAIADGISSSQVSQEASESAVKSFLTDYYCTSDAWQVKTAAQRVIAATNSWLHAQTKRSQNAYDMDRGYVCTLSAMVLKSRSAHIFHIGDSRIYRLSGGSIEQLTQDHTVILSADEQYLERALGMAANVEIDYKIVELEVGDTFLMATDGVYEFSDPKFMTQTIAQCGGDLDLAAKQIVDEALKRGSGDNVTLQIVRIEALPDSNQVEFLTSAGDLPLPPVLEGVKEFDGYKILRQLHANSRSHIYLVEDIESGARMALKIPSIDLRDDPEYLKRLMMEEWIAKRLNNPHVLAAVSDLRPRKFLYAVTEFVEGITLWQWMTDNPKPDLETVRGIIEQIAKGLRAFHRKEMVHQDLRPENIMINGDGTVKIIDFGSTRVAGIAEAAVHHDDPILGTVQYSAPEYFLGETGTKRSDYFSLGVIAYQMLTGKLPYGAQVSRSRTRAQQKKLQYMSAQDDTGRVPDWVDLALKRAVHPDPFKRYETLSGFLYDLRHPNAEFLRNAGTPLMERNPLVFWKVLSLVLGLLLIYLLVR
ncbi:MAG: protein kinase [Rhodobacteraceae bacterium]|nr:MAG: protein kinase [Paracoccaceae bacterium]